MIIAYCDVTFTSGALSLYLQLGLEKKLIVSAVRLVVQLSALGLILKPIFEEKNPLYVIGFQSKF